MLYKITKAQEGCQEPPAQESLRDAFGRWLSELADWDWYATLTFRDPVDPRFPGWTKIGWAAAHSALRKFNSALVSELGFVNPLWVACMELQKRGVPHWHMLVGAVGDESRMKWVHWWYDHFGIARVLPYQEKLGARYYLGKYLTKNLSDIRFSPGLQALSSRQRR